jgi:hypothetical protein
MDMAVWYIRERFQMNWTVVRESLKSSGSCSLGLEEIGRTSCGCMCVRIREELLTVINSCIVNFECNKAPL